MKPDDPRHGTTRGHAAGCRERCCRDARNADERRRRKYRESLGIERTIDKAGTTRRIQALWAMGWTSGHIAKACGWTTPQAITEIVGVRSFVYASTAETVARVYESMCMTHGPSAKNRRDAHRKGWLPPLAWGDDIDDPEATPLAGEPVDIDEVAVQRFVDGDANITLNARERVEAIRTWQAAGVSNREIVKRTGWNVWRYQDAS